jgi:hypothetical protein
MRARAKQGQLIRTGPKIGALSWRGHIEQYNNGGGIVTGKCEMWKYVVGMEPPLGQRSCGRDWSE